MSASRKSAAVPRSQDWLNGAERDRLRVLEDKIERGSQMFVEMGKALAEVRDTRLYRENHESFEAYCKQKWGLNRARAYQLIDAAGVVATVSTTVDTPTPANEAVARELAPLRDDPEAMQETWDKATAAHGPTPTAKQVREVRKPALVAAPDPEASAEDSRFDRLEDAVALLQQMPSPESLVFPTEQGDIEVIGESLDWIAAWVPKAKAAWKQHRAEQRQAARAVA